MKRAAVLTKSAALVGALLILAGCSGSMVTRADMDKVGLLGAVEQQAKDPIPLNPSYRVTKVNVTVPSSLENTETNTYKPAVDIIWREDPLGNRHAQVDKIMTDALTSGTASLRGNRPVTLEVTVMKFHALTQRTRYTIGGTHHIVFAMQVLDSQTGDIVEPLRVIETEFEAYGGDKAIEAEAKGLTQKVRITKHLQHLIAYEVTRPRDFYEQDENGNVNIVGNSGAGSIKSLLGAPKKTAQAEDGGEDDAKDSDA